MRWWATACLSSECLRPAADRHLHCWSAHSPRKSVKLLLSPVIDAMALQLVSLSSRQGFGYGTSLQGGGYSSSFGASQLSLNFWHRCRAERTSSAKTQCRRSPRFVFQSASPWLSWLCCWSLLLCFHLCLRLNLTSSIPCCPVCRSARLILNEAGNTFQALLISQSSSAA